MHCCPQFMLRPHTTRFAARSMSASAATMTGFFPPSSRVTGVRCFTAPCITTRPTAGEPVKKMWSHWHSSSAEVAAWSPGMSAPWPTTVTTCGSKYAGTRRARSRADAAETLHGLSTTQLPAAMAPRTGTSESMMG
eukprot:Amastigsp_a174666_32.p2 type:complete len:136 gc:universal Amastigsp_a174666_32:977-570(-)